MLWAHVRSALPWRDATKAQRARSKHQTLRAPSRAASRQACSTARLELPTQNMSALADFAANSRRKYVKSRHNMKAAALAFATKNFAATRAFFDLSTFSANCHRTLRVIPM